VNLFLALNYDKLELCCKFTDQNMISDNKVIGDNKLQTWSPHGGSLVASQRTSEP